MMNYNNFKDAVVEKFKDYLSEEYQDMELRLYSTQRINMNMDAISLVPSGPEKNVSPVIYINQMFDDYLKTEDLEGVLQRAAYRLENAFKHIPTIGKFDDFDSAKNNIVFQVVNTIQNEDMLTDMPHREFQDLSIIYRRIVKLDEQGIQSIMVNNNIAKMLGMNEEQLYNCAFENTKRILPPTVKRLSDVLNDVVTEMSMETVEMTDSIPDDMTLWVISNNRGVNGAGSILYEDVIHELATKIGSDLYILPSSIHECLAISIRAGDPYELAQMVNEVNMSEVDLDERLSNQVYYYNKEERYLSLATDTPNKRLDGIIYDNEFVHRAGKSK